MSVREATPDDVAGVRQVAERSWSTDYPAVLSRETVEEGVTEWYAPERVGDALARDDTHLLVAEREGRVVGFAHATCEADRGEGHLLRLYVDPDHRGEGLGRALLARVCADLGDRGVDRLYAMVLADNEAGNAFYRAFGFERVDEHETTVGGESYPEYRYALDAPFGVGR